MTSFWLGRGGRALAVLALLGVFTMALPQLIPGDPAIAVLGTQATPEQIALFHSKLDLDQNPFVRFGNWIAQAVQGNLGTSLTTDASIADEFARRLPVTLQLVLASQVIALGLAIPVALRQAWRPNGLMDRIATGISFVLLSMPGFVLGLVLIYLFAVRLSWLPATGWVPFVEDPLGNLRTLVLPALTLGLAEAAIYGRALRSDLVTTLDQPFIHAATSRGMRPGKILVARAFRPSSLSLVTLVGLGIASSIGGSILVETLFAVPGMGRLAQGAILARDFPVIEAVVLVAGCAVVLMNILVDLSYRFIDPRITHGNN